jgi:uncharacterized membrane protein YkvA (DUF1232 family)
MQTERIRNLIEEGKIIERQTGMLRQAVINLANVNGRRVTELEVQKIISFVSDYIEYAPALMKLTEEAAASSGLQHHVQPILDATENYFLAADDIIPDHLGLVGLVDDAYLTHSLMQAISDRYKSQSGRSLLPLETREDNAFVRRLIGEPFVSILDDHVSATLDDPSLQQNIRQMLMALGQTNLSSDPDPVWGHARASEIADARLGAMGLF